MVGQFEKPQLQGKVKEIRSSHTDRKKERKHDNDVEIRNRKGGNQQKLPLKIQQLRAADEGVLPSRKLLIIDKQEYNFQVHLSTHGISYQRKMYVLEIDIH